MKTIAFVLLAGITAIATACATPQPRQGADQTVIKKLPELKAKALEEEIEPVPESEENESPVVEKKENEEAIEHIHHG